MKLLVTGAAGYIGSHAVLELLAAGHSVVAVDNLCNSTRTSLERVEALSGQTVPFIQADIRDRQAMEEVLTRPPQADGATSTATPIDAVMHFAGLKAVGESMEQPLRYYENNVGGTIALLEAMERAGVRRMIFSSSATVYGDPAEVPIPETAPVGEPANPYGKTKLMIEQMLADVAAADDRWAVALLRYFNPVGAHPSGQIGEDPHGIPNNLVPFVSQVAVGRREALSIYGNDYATPDGTGVRDYIHVVDLALGHVRALEALERLVSSQGSAAARQGKGASRAEAEGMATAEAQSMVADAASATGRCRVWNLGTGRGYSVREVVAAFEKVSGQTIKTNNAPRRPGDIATCYADPSRAQTELDWQAEYPLESMLRDAWNWQRQNPNGYDE